MSVTYINVIYLMICSKYNP